MQVKIDERYNAKARGSVDGSSHKKRKRHRAVERDDLVTLAIPASVPEPEAGRGKMASKKRKRLESYVVRSPSLQGSSSYPLTCYFCRRKS